MKWRNDVIQGIQRYFSSISPETVSRGRGYFARGHVLELECIEPHRLYAAIVRGGDDYEVGLEFAGGDWAALTRHDRRPAILVCRMTGEENE